MDAIPNKADKSLDLAALAAETTARPGPIPMRDVVDKFRISACLLCLRGGHTGTPLMVVFKDGTGREKGYACPEHVGQFLRPKDLKKGHR